MNYVSQITKAVIAVLCLSASYNAYSQSIQLSYSTDTIYTTSDESEGFVFITVKNISANTIHVRVDRINEILAGGHETYFCWEQCYPPSNSSSSGTISIAAGDSTKNFTAHVVTNGFEGVSEAVFLFSNEDGANDTASVSLVFDVDAPSGIKQVQKQNEANKISAFVMNNYVTIKGSVPMAKTNVSIYNVNGALVFKQASYGLASEPLKIPIESFSAGIYTIQLISDEVYFSQTLMIGSY